MHFAEHDRSMRRYSHAPLTRGSLRKIGFGTEEKSSVARTLGVGLTEGVLGLIHGRMGGMPEWKKLPLDFGVFAVSAIARFLPWTPRWLMHVTDVTMTGSFGYLGGSLGVWLGQKLRAKAGLLTGAPPTNRPITQGSHTPYDAPGVAKYDRNALVRAVGGRA